MKLRILQIVYSNRKNLSNGAILPEVLFCIPIFILIILIMGRAISGVYKTYQNSQVIVEALQEVGLLIEAIETNNVIAHKYNKNQLTIAWQEEKLITNDNELIQNEYAKLRSLKISVSKRDDFKEILSVYTGVLQKK